MQHDKPQPDPQQELRLSEKEAEQLAAELKEQIQSGQISNANSEQISLMIAGLQDSRGLIRRTFTEGLGKVGKATLPYLKHVLLDHSNVTARRAAAKALRLVGEPNALPALLKALSEDSDEVVQGSAAGAIASFGESGFECFIAILINPQSTAMQCGLAKWGLSFIGAEAPEALLKAAKSQYPEIRAAAIAALSEQANSFGDQNAKQILINALNDSSIEVRAEATAQISQIDEPGLALDLLVKKLSDSSSLVRKSAALSLIKISEPKAIEYLIERELKEKDKDVLNILKLARVQLTKLAYK